MAKQILVLSPRRLVLSKQQGGCLGALSIKEHEADVGNSRVLSTWSQLCQQLGISAAGRGYKESALPLSVDGVDDKHEDELPIAVINRKKDSLDLSFEVRMNTTCAYHNAFKRELCAIGIYQNKK